MSRASKLRSPGLRERLDEGLDGGGGGDGTNGLISARGHQSTCGLVLQHRTLQYGFGALGLSRFRHREFDVFEAAAQHQVTALGLEHENDAILKEIFDIQVEGPSTLTGGCHFLS